MRKFFLTTVLMIASSAAAAGQSSTPAPTPRPTPSGQVQNPVPSRPAVPAVNLSTLTVPNESTASREPLTIRHSIMQEYILPLYRKPGSRELRELRPDPSHTMRYGQVLSRSDSGIFKLVPNAGCAENAKVLNASEECLKYPFPGAGNSFSFRTESYRIRHLADITYDQGSFLMPGVHMYGLMVDLGDVPLEQITLQTPAVQYIAELQPTRDPAAAADMDKLANAGITRNGLLYRRSLPVTAGSTYVARSIAYRGRRMRAMQGIQYNEMDLDKRRDVITAFKVVDIEPDGTATIVWTQLSSSDSPKLKLGPLPAGDFTSRRNMRGAHP